MNREHIPVQDSTTIGQAFKIMREKHFLNLPVERDGKVAYYSRNQESFAEVVRMDQVTRLGCRECDE